MCAISYEIWLGANPMKLFLIVKDENFQSNALIYGKFKSVICSFMDQYPGCSLPETKNVKISLIEFHFG